jgi:predicted nucleic acid-binding protein
MTKPNNGKSLSSKYKNLVTPNQIRITKIYLNNDMYLIDTNIFGFLNRKNPKVIAKFSSVDHSLIYIPSIVWAEICFGLLLMDNSNPKLPKLKAYYSNINQTSYFLDFNKNTAEIFATLKSSSRQSGNI